MRISDWSSDVCSSDLGRIAQYSAAIRAGDDRQIRPQKILDENIGRCVQPRRNAIRYRGDGAETAAIEQVADDERAAILRPEQSRCVAAPERGRVLAHQSGTADQRNRLPAVFGAPRNCEQIAKRSEEHTSELQSLMRHSYAVFCLKKKNTHTAYTH